jgi:hypothetical protein
VHVDVSALSGVHDVFVVIRNSEAGAGDALLILTHIGFRRGGCGGSVGGGAAKRGAPRSFRCATTSMKWPLP